jgi:hypothetical protein
MRCELRKPLPFLQLTVVLDSFGVAVSSVNDSRAYEFAGDYTSIHVKGDNFGPHSTSAVD